MTEEGKTTNAIINVYKNLAAGGVSMIISSLMAVAEKGKDVKDQISIYHENYISEIAKIAAAVHQTDPATVFIAQLCHAGRQLTYDNQTAECVGPSVVLSPLLVRKARELTSAEIIGVGIKSSLKN